MVRKSIRIVNRIEEMEQVTALVETFAKENVLPCSLANDLSVALDEVLNNVISYGYTDEAAHQIGVDLAFEGKHVTVIVCDDGKPFNPLEFPQPLLEQGLKERRVGGLGIHFVRTLMDDCSYSRSDGRNILTLTMRVA